MTPGCPGLQATACFSFPQPASCHGRCFSQVQPGGLSESYQCLGPLFPFSSLGTFSLCPEPGFLGVLAPTFVFPPHPGLQPGLTGFFLPASFFFLLLAPTPF